MPPEHAISFAGGATATSLSPIVLAAILVAVALIMVLPRKLVMWPVFFMFFMVPLGQQIYVGGFHFYTFRIIILFGLARALFAKLTANTELFSGGLNSIDRVFILCTACQSLAVVLLFRSGPALTNQFGVLLDYLGGYFVIRFLIRDKEDIYRAIKCLACLVLIIGACMMYEHFTMRNLFSTIGGQAVPNVREGRVRAQGPFNHELMAGAFGATLFPLCLMLWKSKKAKLISLGGLVGSCLMTWSSNSSTSLLAFGGGIVAIFFWPFRKSMRLVRWGIVFGLIGLQLVMKAPIWFFISHIDLTGGSSSYHRAALIDQFIRHFWDWWLIGIRESGSWGLDMWDAQNQFVSVGMTGGLLGLVLFIVLISRGFARLGNARKVIEGDSSQEWFIWLASAALFAHIVAFFGVNYFDMTKFGWFALLAMISAATTPLLQTSVVPAALAGPSPYTPPIAYASRLVPRRVVASPSQKPPAGMKTRMS